MSKSLSEQLIEICSRPVAKADHNRAALHLLDWTGCALIGSTSPAGLALAAYAADENVSCGPCFAAGTASRGAAEAAFINGGIGNIFELDDVHRTAILHAGDVVLPAALAMAQREGVDGTDLLDAIVRGYEAAIRIGSASAASGYSAWYNSGTCGVFGAAMAAGSILALGPRALADALGQAGMQASGIWQCRLEPTFSKQLGTAHAARAGVVSAQLAKVGFPGAKLILEGELGFFEAYYPRADPNIVTAEPDGRWKIWQVSFKPWPACRHAHPAIEAGLKLRCARSASDISAITVSTYAAAIDFCDNADPASDHEARFSLQHCVAVSLLRGAPELADFTASARADHDIASLRGVVTLNRESEFTERFPSAYGARVDITYADGKTAGDTVLTAKGDPENPMSGQELETKFRYLAGQAGVADDDVAGLLGAVRDLPAGTSLDDLTQALHRVSNSLGARASKGRANSCS